MAIQHGIRDFFATAYSAQFLRKHQFRLRSVNTSALILAEDEIRYSFAQKIPGRKIEMHKQPFMGMDVHYPGTAKYDGGNYEVEIILDGNAAIRSKLERASRIIFNDVNSTGNYRVPSPSESVTLSILNDKLEPIENITLCGVTMHTIEDVGMDYEKSAGDNVKIKVKFSYVYYETDRSDDMTRVANGSATGSAESSFNNFV